MAAPLPPSLVLEKAWYSFAVVRMVNGLVAGLVVVTGLVVVKNGLMSSAAPPQFFILGLSPPTCSQAVGYHIFPVLHIYIRFWDCRTKERQ
jgi:hypothetical protein